MGVHEKALRRLLRLPRDYPYTELNRLFAHWGYRQVKTGHSAGSRVAFVNDVTGHIIRLHRPHPDKQLKRYQLRLIVQALRDQGVVTK